VAGQVNWGVHKAGVRLQNNSVKEQRTALIFKTHCVDQMMPIQTLKSRAAKIYSRYRYAIISVKIMIRQRFERAWHEK
jgi:hypothetical protein